MTEDEVNAIIRWLRNSEIREINNEKVVISWGGRSFWLKAEDISNYVARRPEFKRPLETQLWFPGHYEHVIQFEGSRPRRPSRREDRDKLELVSADGVTRIEISQPSTLFCLCLTDIDQMDRELRRNRSHPLPLILSVAAGLAFV
jgi:hypothetical protein